MSTKDRDRTTKATKELECPLESCLHYMLHLAEFLFPPNKGGPPQST